MNFFCEDCRRAIRLPAQTGLCDGPTAGDSDDNDQSWIPIDDEPIEEIGFGIPDDDEIPF